MNLEFDRGKYLNLAKSDSIQKAVTTLHQDIWEVEYRCFENQNGYDSNLWKQLTSMRLFSRELWDLKLKPQNEW